MRAQAQLCGRPPAPVLAPLAGLVWIDAGGGNFPEAAAVSQQTDKLVGTDRLMKRITMVSFLGHG